MKPEPPRPSEPPKPSLRRCPTRRRWRRSSIRRSRSSEPPGCREPTGGFAFESCNDQGEPPYRGVAEVGFLLPKDMEPEKYFAQIAKTMVGQGWTDGPPPGLKPFGTVIHKGGVMVIMAQHPTYRENGYAQLSGECRNMVDHHNDRKTIAVDITDQLRQR